jgi:hypothetical protein
VVGRDRSETSGAYRVSSSRTTGRFYAIAKKKVDGAADGGDCLKARSGRVTR